MLPHGAHGTPTFSFKTFSRLLKPSARQYLGHKLSLESLPISTHLTVIPWSYSNQ